ncbi:GGDEF domain-containing protein [Sphingomonas abietis]|uniref:diguanylate cyclase n=1 Tax=Sphingomonas abietis TaxID=3012344 RepID=A0ABY7NIS0_9SPHN|nr:GGDEF domain-containing protein [Sphingomonas abietis]WBO21416.1 GGDEF domain-containing protein [Sphingomonas abietis]
MATSLLLSIALAAAWRRFGREAHAALWSLAYGLSAANWAANLLKLWLLPADSGLTLISVVCSVGSFALIALGFRRRAGLPLRWDAIVAAACVTIIFSTTALLRSNADNWTRALIVLFCSAMLVVSAMSLRTKRGDGRLATGGAAFWMLALFAVYTIALGVLALCSPPGTHNAGYEIYRLMMLMGVPTGLFGVGLFAMFLLAADLAEGMSQLAGSDPLTGILNRRGFEQAALPLVAQSIRRSQPLAVVIADIDCFKAFNDRFGHHLGDIVLQRFSAYIGGTIRGCDLFGRLGGEEFVLVLPDTGDQAAVEAMERVRAGLATAVPELDPSCAITASFGIAVIVGRHETLGDMMQRADAALYRSKVEGRDRITLAPATLDGESGLLAEDEPEFDYMNVVRRTAG